MEKIQKLKLRATLFFILVLFAIVSCATFTEANLVTLAWDANTEAELSGYRIYSHSVGEQYSLKAEIPLASLPDPQNPEYTVDISYETYLVATAYSETDESGYSNELFYTLDDPVPPNGATNLVIQYEQIEESIMALIDTGLIVRYYCDEEASGTIPTKLLDASGVGTDVDLTIDYSTDAYFTEVSGNRAWRINDFDVGAVANVAIGSGDKVYDNLHGSKTATIELVVQVDEAESSVGRLFGITGSQDEGALVVCHDDDDGYVRVNEGEDTFAFTKSERAVYHFVIDTNEATAANRCRIYKNGSLHASIAVGGLSEDETIVIQSSSLLCMGNRANDGSRGVGGNYFYAAIYSIAFTAQQASDNYDVLIADDDTPAAGGDTHYLTPSDTINMSDLRSGSFGKPLADQIDLSDNYSRVVSFVRTLGDQIDLSDIIIKNIGKPLSDQIDLSDIIVKSFGLNKGDTVSLSDDFSRVAVFARTIGDAINLSDGIAKSFSTTKTDTITLSDNLVSMIIAIILNLNDTITMSDQFSRVVAYTLSLGDTINLSDIIAKGVTIPLADTINLADQVVKQYGLTESDTISLADSIIRTFGLNKADAILLSDEWDVPGATPVVVSAIKKLLLLGVGR